MKFMRDVIYYATNPAISPENFNPSVQYILKEEVRETTKTYPALDFATFIYILSGSCTYNIDGKLYKVEKGDAVICNPGLTHKKIYEPGEKTMEFNLGVDNICLKNLPANHLIAPNEYPIFRLTKYVKDFTMCCEEIIFEREKNEFGYALLLKSLSMKLIALFLREKYANEQPGEDGLYHFHSNDRRSIVNAIIEFIGKNYMKEISLERISKNMYLSPIYISKIFKEETGDSPINYLIRTRLSKAKELLEQKGLPVKDAAKIVGYDDAYYFSKLYKKYYGCSPSSHKVG